MNRKFLIVFVWGGQVGAMNYNNCWLNLNGTLTREVIMNAAKESGLDPEKVTVICIQELEG